MQLDSSAVPFGLNTFSHAWDRLDEWKVWKDFTFQNLMAMYSEVLNARWERPQPASRLSRVECQIRDERSMDHYLAKFIWPSVNGALDQASRILDWGSDTMLLGTGTWARGDEDYVPDWALVSMPALVTGGTLASYLPGDTKLSAKWQPFMSSTGEARDKEQWTLPLSQIGAYAKEANCRYGFIVTDKTLVVLRFAKERIGEGLAAGRPIRTVALQSHRRTPSEETVVSSHTVTTSSSFGAQSFDEEDPAHNINLEFCPPEYATIPMSASGKGQLTYKFAMFCLCLMAYGGRRELGYDYPPLNSWRREGQWYINNTSNLRARMPPKKAVLD
ncbi:hypothetical protein E4U22_001593 [Claviceps purpurea]|uniref:Uncharacterized protein n=1 Tax=Claviceps purpurea (strain 20.1) TaxID=1111077 RepID=M1WFB9_CLAP2|nr:hypothetical protein E4U51_005267 [Claviceps purpurea]KAG6312726.1 hypothetical protein E4U22_001593 [Claviceps purpurea]CCE30814.1 uncharacterized protein CPUR_04663 [Claviceps purpurea 20.1]